MKCWSFAAVCLVAGGLLGTFASQRVLHGQDAAPPAAQAQDPVTFRHVVKKVLPAVVSIEAKADPVRAKAGQPKRRGRFGDVPIPDEMRRFLEEFEERREVPQAGFGSGFIVDPKGIILTNFHVVGGASRVEVTLQDGTKFTSSDIKGDRKTDLAIVRVQAASPLPYLELGNSDAMEIGDRVLAAGAPFGLAGSVTHGIVSAKGRHNLRMNDYEDFIQTDAAINPGNSGGPLVNLEGKVIGINSMIKTRTGGFQGVGLAIASNMAKNIMAQLRENGTVRRGYLGVGIGELSPEIAERLGVPAGQGGVPVTQVHEGKAAAKSGMQPGDVITGIAGNNVRDSHELRRIVANLPVGKPTQVTVLRDGQPRRLSVTIEEQPDDLDLASRVPRQPPRATPKGEVHVEKMGLEVSDVTAELAEQFGFREDVDGVLITQVEANSPAFVAGLRKGMVIRKIDRRAVTSADSFRQAIEKAALEKGILMQVQLPDGRLEYVLVKPGT
jgi:serine protease Do